MVAVGVAEDIELLFVLVALLIVVTFDVRQFRTSSLLNSLGSGLRSGKRLTR
jgi:hypothetical protein